MKKIIVVLLVLQGVIINLAFAQKPGIAISNKPGWHKIGEITASFKTETESIAVLGADQFKAIKLRATDAAIHIDRATVTYESGETQEIPIGYQLTAGTESEMFDLTRPLDDIKTVSFTYRSMPNFRNEKAQVELYGLK